MPLYDYKCQVHGVFQELAPLAVSASPGQCPQCGLVSPRVILIAPALLDMAPGRREAFATNERSREAPVVSTAASRDQQHGRGCGCEQPSPRKSQVIYLPDGSKVFPSQRPWMISH